MQLLRMIRNPKLYKVWLSLRVRAKLFAPARAVPLGLSPQEHFLAALSAESPLEAEPPIADDLELAVNTIINQNGGERDMLSSAVCQ